jgi:hypothetical protein
MKSHPQKNTLLKNADASAASNFFKRVFFSPAQEEFFPPLFFLFFFRQRTGSVRNRTLGAFNINRLVYNVCKLDTSPLRTDRRASGNKGFKKLAVQWLNEVQFFNQTFVQVDSFVLRNRQLLKPPNRCGAIRRHIGSPDCMRRCGLERLTSAHLRDFSADRSFATPAPKPRKSGDPLAPMQLQCKKI